MVAHRNATTMSRKADFVARSNQIEHRAGKVRNTFSAVSP